jgi:hypothetical protein
MAPRGRNMLWCGNNSNTNKVSYVCPIPFSYVSLLTASNLSVGDTDSPQYSKCIFMQAVVTYAVCNLKTNTLYVPTPPCVSMSWCSINHRENLTTSNSWLYWWNHLISPDIDTNAPIACLHSSPSHSIVGTDNPWCFGPIIAPFIGLGTQQEVWL